ncbi:hypothetical protein [Pseudozobellia sp. WGM2]|uniref:hypothetical protein n=1 Tax=Pseudozobellia sp. WGM2 TaxID=2787625 RepID=UPI001ADF2D46|nr:hypothetical protein [Pseudozobellia sp. WGM2]
MKLATALFFTLCFLGVNISVDIEDIRQTYRSIQDNEDSINDLYESLTSVAKNDEATLVAYKGAATTMMAKFASGFKDKRTFFNDGRELLEYAVEAQASNVEIRCIRLSVQENAPRILGYHKDIDTDKQFIIDNYSSMKDKAAKDFVKGFVAQSDSFSEEQKQLF